MKKDSADLCLHPRPRRGSNQSEPSSRPCAAISSRAPGSSTTCSWSTTVPTTRPPWLPSQQGPGSSRYRRQSPRRNPGSARARRCAGAGREQRRHRRVPGRGRGELRDALRDRPSRPDSRLPRTSMLVKACYRRPFGECPTGGGRVTELVARPLVSLLFPELSGVVQPLAGEVAVRRRGPRARSSSPTATESSSGC